MTEPTLTDLYGSDLAAATIKLAAVNDAIDALDRVVVAIGALDGATYGALDEMHRELTIHIDNLIAA